MKKKRGPKWKIFKNIIQVTLKKKHIVLSLYVEKFYSPKLKQMSSGILNLEIVILWNITIENYLSLRRFSETIIRQNHQILAFNTIWFNSLLEIAIVFIKTKVIWWSKQNNRITSTFAITQVEVILMNSYRITSNSWRKQQSC